MFGREPTIYKKKTESAIDIVVSDPYNIIVLEDEPMIFRWA